jgi:hypothetical protein
LETIEVIVRIRLPANIAFRLEQAKCKVGSPFADRQVASILGRWSERTLADSGILGTIGRHAMDVGRELLEKKAIEYKKSKLKTLPTIHGQRSI